LWSSATGNSSRYPTSNHANSERQIAEAELAWWLGFRSEGDGAPVTGMIFAFVLSLFFAGGMLSGSVFPAFQSDWFLVFF
jgi:hypothetical protein